MLPKKSCLFFCGVLLSGLWGFAAAAADDLSVRFEVMAKNLHHFSQEEVVYNRHSLGWFGRGQRGSATENELLNFVHEQQQLPGELRALDGDRDALAACLRHPDPKVRTLALGALYQREDGRDLPLIASLIDDTAPTLPDFYESKSSTPIEPKLRELETSQTVGEVARRMLDFYDIPDMIGHGSATKAKETFDAYWSRHAGQETAASWFVLRMKRATRQTTPIMGEYRPDIQRVLADMAALPMPQRAWTQLYVLEADRRFTFQDSGLIVSPDEVIEMIKPLGADTLMRFLRGEKVSEDADLAVDVRTQTPGSAMTASILLHADRLLRAEDADTLLTLGHAHGKDLQGDTLFFVAAALVQPARAGEILHGALDRALDAPRVDTSVFAGYLWRLCGPAEADFLADWFYSVGRRGPSYDTAANSCLNYVEAKPRPDVGQLVAALVRHPGFNQTDRERLKTLLTIVNKTRRTPLVDSRAIYGAWPPASASSDQTLATWRNLLRREFGAAEQPPSAALPPAPKYVLTKPLWSVGREDGADQIILSPDGKRVVFLIKVAAWLQDAATGRGIWHQPAPEGGSSLPVGHPLRFPSYAVAFSPDGTQLVAAGERLFCAWDLPADPVLGQGPAPSWWGRGGREITEMDPQGKRAAVEDKHNLDCYDPGTGQFLWQQKDFGGEHGLLAFSPDGTRLAMWSSDHGPRRVQILDAATGQPVQTLAGHRGYILDLAFSADGRCLLTNTLEDGLQLWDVATAKKVRDYAYPAQGEGLPAFSPDGRWLALAGKGTDRSGLRLGVLSVDTGELVWEIREEFHKDTERRWAVAFSRDSRLLYVNLQAWRLDAAAK